MTKTKTRYVCKECSQPTKKNQVMVPPLFKGSKKVICRPCANRPTCQMCESPGSMDKKAPEMQLGHPLFGEIVMLVHYKSDDGEAGISCRGCVQNLQKAGIRIREVNLRY